MDFNQTEDYFSQDDAKK